MGRFTYFVLLLSVFAAASCTTTDPIIPNGFGFGGGRPGWIDEYPVDPLYYIGVGSSKTGDQGADMETARIRAIASLAGSISTQIRSDVKVTAREDSDGNAAQTAEQILRETVDQHVREVEIVDSYYSDEDGYWFFVRLSKVTWAEIQAEEMDRLRRRVLSLVEPDLLDERVSIVGRIGTLWKGWELLAESPYSDVVEGNLLGQEGLLIDLIEGEMVAYVDSLSISVFPELLSGAPGKPLEIEIEVRNRISLSTGPVSVVLTAPDGHSVAELTTEPDGTYSGTVDVGGIEMGTTIITAVVDIGRTGIDLRRVPKRIYLPEKDLAIEISQIRASLTIEMSEDSELGDLRGTFESLLTPRVPVQFTSPTDADYDIRVYLTFRNAPANEYGIIVVYSKAVFSVVRAGSTLVSYETSEEKDGGLSISQAQTRSLGKLIDAIGESGELTSALAKGFSLE